MQRNYEIAKPQVLTTLTKYVRRLNSCTILSVNSLPRVFFLSWKLGKCGIVWLGLFCTFLLSIFEKNVTIFISWTIRLYYVDLFTKINSKVSGFFVVWSSGCTIDRYHTCLKSLLYPLRYLTKFIFQILSFELKIWKGRLCTFRMVFS